MCRRTCPAAMPNSRSSPAGSAVPVREWVDRLELRVHNGRMSEYRHVLAREERNEVCNRGWDPIVVGRNEERASGSEIRAADPHLLRPPDPRPRRVGLAHQLAVHAEDGISVQVIGKLQWRTHGGDVGDDETRVVPGGVPEFCHCYRSRRGRQVLDARRRCRLGPEQHGGERDDLCAGVEARHLVGGIINGRCEHGLEGNRQGRDRGGNRRTVGASLCRSVTSRAEHPSLGRPPRQLLVGDSC